MNSPSRFLRPAAGAAVLLMLALIALLLIPPYVQNWKLQRFVNELHDDPAAAAQPVDAIRVRILNRAAALGLPVHNNDVHVTQSSGALRIDVLYVVHVDVAGYAVDLHFRPAAGGT